MAPSGTADVEFAFLGWPDDEPTLRLDFRSFSYAGKFVMSTTGKAVVRRAGAPQSEETASPSGDAMPTANGGASPVAGAAEETGNVDDAPGAPVATARDADYPTIDPSVFDSDVLAAVAFNEDRTDPGVLWLRYVTVHREHRGRGLGARLAAFVVDRAAERGYRRFRIAVNNPFSYQALYKAGFVFTNRETGLAEVVLERPGECDRATYQCGLDVFRDRDLDERERQFLDRKEGADPPARVDPPTEWVREVHGSTADETTTDE